MTQKYRERIAVFAGTFNPFTIGHADIVRRGLELFDKVVVCVGVNVSKPGDEQLSARRASAIKALWADDARVEACSWSGLTADLAAKVGATHLLRGVRSVKDYEYERDMADANKQAFGIDTVILFARPDLGYVTSSLVRELRAFGKDELARSLCPVKPFDD